jgi:hypothetical protein
VPLLKNLQHLQNMRPSNPTFRHVKGLATWPCKQLILDRLKVPAIWIRGQATWYCVRIVTGQSFFMLDLRIVAT